jgi:hypothetical protein
MRSGTRHGAGAALLALVVLAAGCSSAEQDAGASAEAFYAALAARDGEGACELLAPETQQELETSAGAACAAAVLEELPGASAGGARVAAYGEEARAEVAGQVAFLALFTDGWKVVAAGCTPQRRGPYDCTLQGG